MKTNIGYTCSSCGRVYSEKEIMESIFEQRQALERKVKGLLTQAFDKPKVSENVDDTEIIAVLNKLEIPKEMHEEIIYNVRRIAEQRDAINHAYFQKLVKAVAFATLYAYGKITRAQLKTLADKHDINYNRVSKYVAKIDESRMIKYFTQQDPQLKQMSREKQLKYIHDNYNKNIIFPSDNTRPSIINIRIMPRRFYATLNSNEAIIETQRIRINNNKIIIEGEGQLPAGTFPLDHDKTTINGIEIRIKHDKLIIIPRKNQNFNGVKPYIYQAYITFDAPLPRKFIQSLKRVSLNGWAIEIGTKRIHIILQPEPNNATKIFIPSIRSEKQLIKLIEEIKQLLK